jgi:hypothetical protein
VAVGAGGLEIRHSGTRIDVATSNAARIIAQRLPAIERRIDERPGYRLVDVCRESCSTMFA